MGGFICTTDYGKPNEGKNQRYLKNWADVAAKICFGRTQKFESGSEFLTVR